MAREAAETAAKAEEERLANSLKEAAAAAAAKAAEEAKAKEAAEASPVQEARARETDLLVEVTQFRSPGGCFEVRQLLGPWNPEQKQLRTAFSFWL